MYEHIPGNARKSNLKCGNNFVLDELVHRGSFFVKGVSHERYVRIRVESFGPETDSHLAGGRVNAHAAGSVARGHPRNQSFCLKMNWFDH